MLMKISEYRETKFTESSRPSINTVKKWINDGEIPGQILGGLYYVNVNAVAPANDLVNKVLNK